MSQLMFDAVAYSEALCGPLIATRRERSIVLPRTMGASRQIEVRQQLEQVHCQLDPYTVAVPMSTLPKGS